MWGGWLAVHAAAFTVGTVAHAYFVVALAPAVAALAGGGLRLLWWGYQYDGWQRWLLPATVGLTAGWAVWLGSAYPGFRPALPVVAATGTAVGVLLLVGAVALR